MKLAMSSVIYFSAATISLAQMPTTIFVGTVYNIFHEEFATDEEFFKQVDRDIALMKESNITHVMIFPMSQWDPDTKQLLWKRTDYLVKKIEDAQMKFVPLMLKEEQCSHYFPIWKFKEIPGLWEEYNLNNGNKNNRENVDFADPRVYPLVEEYFKAVIERYGKSPALSFYNIWNEPHYNSTAGHVIERFRKWLQVKYGTLPSLRRAWGKEYSDWDQVSPFLTDNWSSSMPQIDWIMFRNELNGAVVTTSSFTLCIIMIPSIPLTPTRSAHPGQISTTTAGIILTTGRSPTTTTLTAYHTIPMDGKENIIWSRALSGCIISPSILFEALPERKIISLPNCIPMHKTAWRSTAISTAISPKNLAWTALANDCKGIIYWKWLPFMRGRQSLGRG